MTVSVIIPAYNASLTIAKTLTALRRQDFRQDLEIIVVDDGSTDRTSSVVDGFAGVRYVRQDNAGPASARNHGARLSRGTVLCFTDSDCIPHADWISRLVGGFRHNDVGVVCGSYGIANPQSRLARGIHGEILFRHQVLMPDFPKVFGSYNFSIQKQVFDQVGGFSTTYRQASGEDNDLSYKVLKSGQRIFFERRALVDHEHPQQVWQYLKEQFRHGYWRVAMYTRHPDMVTGDHYTFWKDMLEVPWALGCLLGLASSVLGVISLNAVIYFLFFPLLIFEIFFASRWCKFFDGIFFGFVMFLRTWARTFGLSTGIFCFLAIKTGKFIK